ALIEEGKQIEPQARPAAQRTGAPKLYQFWTVTGGTISYDHSVCANCETKICVEACVPQILSLTDDGLPVLNITPEEAAKGRCSECLACEVECFFHGAGGGKIELPIPGLDE
ncbi:MAG: hypothetical protein PVF47_18555, partial [Anaerolineae bacterium]